MTIPYATTRAHRARRANSRPASSSSVSFLSVPASHIDKRLIGTRPSHGRGSFRYEARLAIRSLRASCASRSLGRAGLPARFRYSSSPRRRLAIGIDAGGVAAGPWIDRGQWVRPLRRDAWRRYIGKLGARRRVLRRGRLAPFLLPLRRLRRLERLSRITRGRFTARFWIDRGRRHRLHSSDLRRRRTGKLGTQGRILARDRQYLLPLWQLPLFG